VPSYHQGVEIDTLLAAGYQVRYYRVTEQLCVNLEDVEQRVDDTVSALYVIHYFGFAQPLDPIRRFCDAHRLQLIEDCALSLFSRANGTWLGSVGDLALYSVYKTLPLPHGGFLLTKAGQPASALPPAPLASTFIQTLDLLHQGLQASGWGRLERW
jgi:dTDP-4-amino-4,6-dideoxygalactose transaminase